MPDTTQTQAEGLLKEQMNKGIPGEATCTQRSAFLGITACLHRAQTEETGGDSSSPVFPRHHPTSSQDR